MVITFKVINNNITFKVINNKSNFGWGIVLLMYMFPIGQ